MDFQTEKQVVLDYYAALDAARPQDVGAVISHKTGPEFQWRGMHPFNELIDPQSVGDTFWAPLKTALTSMQRRMDVFMAGANSLDDGASRWVVSMGHLMGLFDASWLGITPTGKLTMLRYAAFHRVEAGRIVEEAMFFDIPHLMIQAGLDPFPPATAQHMVQPGPATHDGLLYAAQDPTEGEKTLAAINAMIEDLGTWELGLPLEEELARTWHDDMLWWGPAGIGATYTIERYAKQHSAPFRAAFKDRSKTQHICRFGEGAFGGFFGWPNFSVIHTGGFMGMPGSDATASMRVVDIYRRRGDKLIENWIFIDLLHFWDQLGLDVLGRTTGVTTETRR